MNTFKASNGVSVMLRVDGSLLFRGSHNVTQTIDAAREYFQAERDQELGRWRDPENPDYVVYPDKNNRHIQQPAVIIINEKTGGFSMCGKDDTVSSSGIGAETNINVWRVVAKHYFATHPEKKPWHDARPGEVWMIRVGREEMPYELAPVLYLPDREKTCFLRGPDHLTAVDFWNIQDAYRIWPEQEDGE